MYGLKGMLKTINNNPMSYSMSYDEHKHCNTFLNTHFLPIAQQPFLLQSVTKVHKNMFLHAKIIVAIIRMTIQFLSNEHPFIKNRCPARHPIHKASFTSN
ncbi:hypothetical protein Dimus_037946 [Dionaea muscipula]